MPQKVSVAKYCPHLVAPHFSGHHHPIGALVDCRHRRTDQWFHPSLLCGGVDSGWLLRERAPVFMLFSRPLPVGRSVGSILSTICISLEYESESSTSSELVLSGETSKRATVRPCPVEPTTVTLTHSGHFLSSVYCSPHCAEEEV